MKSRRTRAARHRSQTKHRAQTRTRLASKSRSARGAHARKSRSRVHSARTQKGGFFPYPSQQFGSNMVDSEEAGGAVVVRNVSGVPTVMSADKYKREYRGEYDEGI